MENSDNNNSQTLKSVWKKEDLKEGMKIKLFSFSEPAIITSISYKKNHMQVQIGNAKMNAKISDIENVYSSNSSSSMQNSNNFPNAALKNSVKNSFKAKEVSTEINVITIIS